MTTEDEHRRGQWAKSTIDSPFFKELEDEFKVQAFQAMLEAPIDETGDATRRKAALMANAVVDFRNWLEGWSALAD